MAKKQTHLQKRIAETMTVKKLDVFRALVFMLVLGLLVGVGIGYGIWH